jgi:hypothetical protein
MSTADYKILSNLYKRLFLQPLGLNTDNSIVLWLLLLFGAITLGGLWYFQGQVPVVLAILYFVGIFFLSFLRLDYSLYILVLTVLLFDQHLIPEFNPITYQVDFFRNLKEISYIPSFKAGMVNPVEIHLFFIVLSLLMLMSIKKDFEWRPIPVVIPFLVFFLCLAFSFFNGLRGGEDFLVALWEIRALFYFCLLYIIVPQIIRQKEQIYVLVWIFIIIISFKAFQAIGRFVELGFTTGDLQTLTTYEDPVFVVTLLILLLGFLLYNVKNKQRLWLLLLLPPLILGFYLGMQSAAYVSFVISLVIFFLILPMPKMWKFIKYSIPILILVAVYSAAFWNNDGHLGRPIQMIKSGIMITAGEANMQDYYSYFYRNLENYNLAHTVTNNPVLGTGFGDKYDQPLPMVHTPHNGLIWLLIKMGAVGFFAFWLFFNSFVAKGVRVFSRLTDPYLKVIMLVVLIAVVNQIVVSFFDLQLAYYRNMIYLGCLMGFLPALERTTKPNDEKSDKLAKY